MAALFIMAMSLAFRLYDIDNVRDAPLDSARTKIDTSGTLDCQPSTRSLREGIASSTILARLF